MQWRFVNVRYSWKCFHFWFSRYQTCFSLENDIRFMKNVWATIELESHRNTKYMYKINLSCWTGHEYLKWTVLCCKVKMWAHHEHLVEKRTEISIISKRYFTRNWTRFLYLLKDWFCISPKNEDNDYQKMRNHWQQQNDSSIH